MQNNTKVMDLTVLREFNRAAMCEDWLPDGSIKQQKCQEINCLLGMQNNNNVEDFIILWEFTKTAM